MAPSVPNFMFGLSTSGFMRHLDSDLFEHGLSFGLWFGHCFGEAFHIFGGFEQSLVEPLILFGLCFNRRCAKACGLLPVRFSLPFITLAHGFFPWLLYDKAAFKLQDEFLGGLFLHLGDDPFLMHLVNSLALGLLSDTASGAR